MHLDIPRRLGTSCKPAHPASSITCAHHTSSKQVLQLEPDNAQGKEGLDSVLQDLQRVEQRQQNLKTAAESDPDFQLKQAKEKGNQAFMSQDFEKAVFYFGKGLELDPHNEVPMPPAPRHVPATTDLKFFMWGGPVPSCFAACVPPNFGLFYFSAGTLIAAGVRPRGGSMSLCASPCGCRVVPLAVGWCKGHQALLHMSPNLQTDLSLVFVGVVLG